MLLERCARSIAVGVTPAFPANWPWAGGGGDVPAEVAELQQEVELLRAKVGLQFCN